MRAVSFPERWETLHLCCCTVVVAATAAVCVEGVGVEGWVAGGGVYECMCACIWTLRKCKKYLVIGFYLISPSQYDTH